MASNVAVAQDPAGNLKPAKDKSTERIDGIVAVIMALGRAMVAQDEQFVHRVCSARSGTSSVRSHSTASTPSAAPTSSMA